LDPFVAESLNSKIFTPVQGWLLRAVEPFPLSLHHARRPAHPPLHTHFPVSPGAPGNQNWLVQGLRLAIEDFFLLRNRISGLSFSHSI
jgi:hypothetical protein